MTFGAHPPFRPGCEEFHAQICRCHPAGGDERPGNRTPNTIDQRCERTNAAAPIFEGDRRTEWQPPVCSANFNVFNIDSEITQNMHRWRIVRRWIEVYHGAEAYSLAIAASMFMREARHAGTIEAATPKTAPTTTIHTSDAVGISNTFRSSL